MVKLNTSSIVANTWKDSSISLDSDRLKITDNYIFVVVPHEQEVVGSIPAGCFFEPLQRCLKEDAS